MTVSSTKRRPNARYDKASTGAETVVRTLKEMNANLIFGMTGAAIMPVYDAFYNDPDLKHVIAGHEQGAAHMAEGWARATGKTGVVMTTSGPGASNLATGLANAMADSTPLAAITGQVATGLIGRDAFQEVDIRGMTMPITKHNYQATEATALGPILTEAFELTSTGRPGPVLIDMPKDILTAEIPAASRAKTRPVRRRVPFEGHPIQIGRALELLKNARRPVMLLGGGVILGGAATAVCNLAETLDMPVTSSMMGLGAFPADHRLWLGMAGMHGHGAANMALHNADYILCLGCRLSDRLTGRPDSFAKRASLIHVDIDPSEIGKNIPARVPIVGHVKPVVQELSRGVGGWLATPDLEGWWREITDWRERHPMTYRTSGDLIAPQSVPQELGKLLDEDDIVTTGVGQHQMFTAQYYPVRKPGGLITSGGLGVMGFGLPSAIGAALGRPEARVVTVDGDGSHLMTIQEMATAVNLRLPVVVTILRNARLGMVSQWQELFLDQRFAETEITPPDYYKVAQAFGALGKRISRPEELRKGLEWALNSSIRLKTPAVLEIEVDPGQCVLPMVPAGKSNAEFIPCQQ